MKIFYLSLHPPLDPARPATGNQVRDAGLIAALEAAGHQVTRHWLRSPGREAEAGGSLASALPRLLAESGAEAVLVGYWTLLEQLPETKLPVVLDFIAPRLLEALYQEPGTVQYESRRLLALLPRADHFLVGNRRQGDLLLGLLLLCGFDCRERMPVSEVPISVSGEPSPFPGELECLRLVSAGVDWPWRQSGEYFALLEEYAAGHPRVAFAHVSGSYPGSGKAEGAKGLAGYREMQALFARSHIGLEVGRRNTEREFSHSFRLAEYLQAGLPVVLNPWLPAAELVARYDAGWLVESPQALAALLDRLRQDEAELLGKAAGARRLATEALNYRETILPLLRWLQRPERPRREFFLAPEQAEDGAPRAGEAGWRGRVRHVAAELFRLLFCRRRPPLCPDLLMLTRADLFPPDHGAAVKILRTAEALSRHGGDVWLCTDSRREYYRFREGEMATLRYPLWLRLLGLPRPLALLRLLARGLPASNAFLYFPLTDESYLARVLWLGVRHPVGAFHAEFPAYVQPLRVARRLLGGRLLLVEHNVEYERIRAQVAGLPERGYRYLKELELRMCAAADAVVTVSEQDMRILLRDGVDPRKLHCIPHGVDLAAFRQAQPKDVRSLFNIPASHALLVYHGTYSYPPNLQAMQAMAQEVLPRLERAGLQVSVLALGSRPPARALHERLHFTGSVANPAEYIGAADLAVVPLLEGGGTRMKILDYFAAGVPVVSTAKGIEGIPVENGREALIAEGCDALAEAAARLLKNREEALRLAENARVFVEGLGWEAIAARYLPLLGKRP